MTPAKLLSLEGRAFLLLLAATLAWMLLTRRIALSGLLLRDNGAVSPERLQLLLSTFVVAGHLLFTVVASTTTTMPELKPEWDYAFGGSGALYAVVKAATTWGPRNKRRQTA